MNIRGHVYPTNWSTVNIHQPLWQKTVPFYWKAQMLEENLKSQLFTQLRNKSRLRLSTTHTISKSVFHHCVIEQCFQQKSEIRMSMEMRRLNDSFNGWLIIACQNVNQLKYSNSCSELCYEFWNFCFGCALQPFQLFQTLLKAASIKICLCKAKSLQSVRVIDCSDVGWGQPFCKHDQRVIIRRVSRNKYLKWASCVQIAEIVVKHRYRWYRG
jgi:hypothetical protein